LSNPEATFVLRTTICHFWNAGEEMLVEDEQDGFLHSSIPSKDTYEDEENVSFSGNQHIAHAGYGNLDSYDNN
jgi:hypothetical protein